jgi:MFS family permease
MHGMEEFKTSPEDLASSSGPWYRDMTRYHWFVLFVAALGWLFDCLDQQLFVLSRPAAMKDLVPAVMSTENPEAVDAKATDLARSQAGNTATALFLAGWATGGLFFGMMGDRIGRAKTMMITILMYSAFTGLSAISTNVWDFSLYRFLTGLGVGGEFAVGVALVAEVMPNRARTVALSLLQALSAFGNISAAAINLGLGVAEEHGLPTSPWRIMFMIGAVPALLALVIRRNLKEPERWQQASHDDVVKKQLGSYSELLGNPRWRKNALLGLVLACSGVIGLWAVGFFAPDLIRTVQRKGLLAEVLNEKLTEAKAENDTTKIGHIEALIAASQSKGGMDALPAETKAFQKENIDPTFNGRLTRWASYTSFMTNFGAFFGIFGFGLLAQWFGRRPTFAIFLILAFFSTAAVFWYLTEFWQIFVMIPIMGFCQLSLFGGYAIYFPELFPTRLRSTGTSFCYNVGRFVAAGGPLAKSWLEGFFKDTPEPLRYAGVTMCFVFAIGLFVLPFLPETKGQPLPE